MEFLMTAACRIIGLSYSRKFNYLSSDIQLQITHALSSMLRVACRVSTKELNSFVAPLHGTPVSSPPADILILDYQEPGCFSDRLPLFGAFTVHRHHYLCTY